MYAEPVINIFNVQKKNENEAGKNFVVFSIQIFLPSNLNRCDIAANNSSTKTNLKIKSFFDFAVFQKYIYNHKKRVSKAFFKKIECKIKTKEAHIIGDNLLKSQHTSTACVILF
jgi:hypothetical protein